MFYIAIFAFIISIVILNKLSTVSGGSLFKLMPTKRSLTVQDKAEVAGEWKSIMKLVEQPGASTSHEAIIKADKLLAFVLGKLVSVDGSLGDQLKMAKDLFSEYEIYDTAWKAHKMRNAVVHERDFEVTKVSAKKVLESYKKVLGDLGAL